MQYDARLKTILPEDQVIVPTDRRAAGQILLNLASNAIKFTDSGEVCVVLARYEQDGNKWTQISVNDTGRGIRPEDQSRLFEPFARIEDGARHREGTGLGLQLSQKLAELLGGQITFKSEYGRGSTFTLHLPES